ncbi:glycoside hydrolase family 13 protein [Extibacter muris]|uniref:glycoside hydrolase family 13 protein n=1 Tax=Extibacter muris TaxID=1796622 RepID=UPI001D083A94|nr:glycoside hydrolase family 13 protein [Extibacter muris]MCB6203750.1 glycoside hydrolase family 13 protein [Extibacter muris]MCQ4665492.1 glycoside hydrolase family 13 protein [Extibacter muris]MCQ4694871.1 glycoside hydrolase family 13 protein [Extibacter muris]
MKEQALFCDGTASYVSPPEPAENERVTLRFRTAKDDVDSVRLVTRVGGYEMELEDTRGGFDYYTISWRLNEERFHYCFEIRSGEEVCFYNRCGVSKEVVEFYDFVIAPGFSTPDWAKGAVMYQIYTDRFYNGDKSNDVESNEYFYIGGYSRKVTDWNKYPDTMGVREFYGGDLKGVMDKLDYLQELGVEVLYFNPLFVSPSNHKYDIQDYDYIDPHYGVILEDGGEVLPEGVTDNSKASKYQKRTTDRRNLEASNQLFIQLVEELHRRGMKIILDGVFNHCGSFNKWMDRERIYESQDDYDKGAYVSPDSPYRSYFRFYKEEPENWPYNHNYDGWWGHDTLPKLNYEDSVKLENYILYIGRKWVSPPYNVDGWRLDVAADLGRSNEYNHQFWKKFRVAVKDANPDALILAEHYGDPSEWLRGDEWDTVMNYDAFMEPVTWFLTGMEKHSDEAREELSGNADNFVGSISHHMSNMLTPSLQVAMNELSNHDHSRFLTRTNHMVGRVEKLGPQAAEAYVNPAVMREAVVIQMTWTGAPTVYYGDEAGVCGFTDPDNRRTYPWGNEDKEMLSFHKEMIRIHKEHKALRTGSLNMLSWAENMLAYGRFLQEEQIIVIINNRSELTEVTVPVWRAEVPAKCRMRRLIYSYTKGYTTEYEEYLVDDGELVVNMGAHSALVLETIAEER